MHTLCRQALLQVDAIISTEPQSTTGTLVTKPRTGASDAARWPMLVHGAYQNGGFGVVAALNPKTLNPKALGAFVGDVPRMRSMGSGLLEIRPLHLGSSPTAGLPCRQGQVGKMSSQADDKPYRVFGD